MLRRRRQEGPASAPAAQRGITLISFLLLMGLLGLCAVLLVRVGPIYFDHYMIRSTVQGLEQDRDLKTKSREEILDLLRRRWEINNVDGVTTGNVKIERDEEKLRVQLRYDVVRHVFGNLDVVVRFDDLVMIDLRP